MMNRFSFLRFLVASLLFAPPGKAALIYDNGAPGQADGFEMTHWIEADDFVLTSPTLLSSIKFWDLERGANFQSSIVWRICSNSSPNKPGSVLFSGTSLNLTHTATGLSSGSYAEFVNTFDITPALLQPGTYWLCLHNGPLTNNTSQLVFWEKTRHIGAMFSQSDQTPFNGSWGSNVFLQRVTAFEIIGSAPRITFDTISLQMYRVEYNDRLIGGSWTTVAGADMLTGTGGAPLQVTDPNADVRSLPHRFYRVMTAADLAFQLSNIP